MVLDPTSIPHTAIRNTTRFFVSSIEPLSLYRKSKEVGELEQGTLPPPPFFLTRISSA
jgi:hypothetical protein